MTRTVFIKALGLTLGALSFSACGLIQTHSKDDASVTQIKRAAVVAISVYEPASATMSLSLNSGKASAEAGGSLIPGYDAHIDEMYQNLGQSFAKNMSWNVMSVKTMLGNKGYQTAFDKTMKGWQNKMPPGKGQRQLLVKDVMDFDSARILGGKGRDELIDALGVDAIIVARISVNLNGSSVMGVGERHPQTDLSFFIYKKGEEKPIWFEGQIKGDEATESVGKTAFIDEALLGRLALKSAKTAFAKIGTTTVQ